MGPFSIDPVSLNPIRPPVQNPPSSKKNKYTGNIHFSLSLSDCTKCDVMPASSNLMTKYYVIVW